MSKNKYGFFDLHRHDEASSFDGFGTPADLVLQAKELGYEALGISNHGVTYSNVKHFVSCRDNGLKPVLGCEVYFQPKFDKEKPSYHLCLFAQNSVGFSNMNKIITLAEDTKYYKPRVIFKYLEDYSEGVICTSACIAGPISQALVNGKNKTAYLLASKFKDIFGDNFYMEVQPYKISDEGVQEEINVKEIKIANRLGIKCVLTSDSHMGSKEDFPTYLKMHEMSKPGLTMDIKSTYGERYMPLEEDIIKRFVNMHGKDFGLDKAKKMAIKMCRNLKEIQDKVDSTILDDMPLSLPKLFGDDSHKELIRQIQNGLKRIGKRKDKEYVSRAKEELKVIRLHGFEDYFLIVSDYVNWAKDRGIAVGPGRGSVCNSMVAYLLNITTTDPIKFGLDFSRFLREDKKKLPDVDLDFEMGRRQEVVEYILERYNSSQISSYGLYKYDNLINDLAKVCGLKIAGDGMSESQKQANKATIKEIKNFVRSFSTDEKMNWEEMIKNPYYARTNSQYDNLLLHFRKLFAKLRFIGTHAAGLVVSDKDLSQYAPLKIIKDKKTGHEKATIMLDMLDLETVNAVKFDTLGLKTMEGLAELRKMAGKPKQWNIADTEYLYDSKIYDEFGKGNTDGIFQFASHSGKGILETIGVDNFDDVSAASAMNRPGPLMTGMPDQYALAKQSGDASGRLYKYTKETYGAIVYQEQITAICRNEGNLSPADADKVLKLLKSGNFDQDTLTGTAARVFKDRSIVKDKFMSGCISNGINEEDADDMFESMMVYTFNKGHSVGYSLISLEEMYYKVYYPTYYWTVKLKYTIGNDSDYGKYQSKAVCSGEVIFLPHVNYSKGTTVRKVEGDTVIQLGIDTIKGVGKKAAESIEQERKKRPFRNYDDFVDRCRNRQVHKGVIEKLLEGGALEFKKSKYHSRVVKFNSVLWTRGVGR